jgi:hypothetical protein
MVIKKISEKETSKIEEAKSSRVEMQRKLFTNMKIE